MASKKGIKAARAYVEIFADNSKLIRGLRAARRRIKAFGAGLRNIGMRIAGVGVLGSTLLFAAAKSFASFGDKIAKMSKRTGVSVRALSELGFVASQTGTDIDTLEVGFRRMQRSIYDAGRGLSTQADALDAMKLQYKDLKGLAPEKQFLMLADGMTKVGDASKKSGVASAFFGRAGTMLLPMFAHGAKGIERLRKVADRLGITMGKDEVVAAEHLTDAFDILWKTVSMGVFHIGASLAPKLTDLSLRIAKIVGTISNWVKKNKELVVKLAEVFAAVTATGIALIVLGALVASVGAIFGGMATMLGLVGAAVGVVVTAVTFLATPLALVILSLAGLITLFFKMTAAGGIAFAWLGKKFVSLVDDAKKAYGGIADALRSGDISLAAKIFWLYLKIEWIKGVHQLQKIWAISSNVLLKISSDIWWSALTAAEDAWHTLQTRWIDVTASLERTWEALGTFFARSWLEIQAGAEKTGNIIKGAFQSPDSIPVINAANKKITSRLNFELSQIDKNKSGRKSLIEKDRAAALAKEAIAHNGATAVIDTQNQKRNLELEKAFNNRDIINQDALNKAKAAWLAAIAKAKKERASGVSIAGSGIDSFLDYIRNMIDSIGDKQNKIGKIGVRGTFVAANVLGLQAESANQVAENIKKIKDNTNNLKHVKTLVFTK